jgi:arsenate reductase-like glutaredoxin family protein
MLTESSLDFQEIHYLDALPTVGKLMDLLAKADFVASDLVRFGEAQSVAMSLSKDDKRTDE